MNIKNDYPVMIFKKGNQYGTFYTVGMSKKDRDGNYINGYMPCQFKLGVSVEDKTKIYIKSAWLTFYLKDKETKPYIFINEFDLAEVVLQEAKIEPLKKDPFEEMGAQVQFDNEDMDLPF